jgi:Flp pilus assembly CpaE family ATPase
VSNAATVAVDPDFAALVTAAYNERDAELIVWDDVTPESLLDADGHPRVEAVLLRGALISQHLLSGCDLAGIRIVGVAHTPEDELNLERLRLRECVATPLETVSVRRALGLSSPAAESSRDDRAIRTTPSLTTPSLTTPRRTLRAAVETAVVESEVVESEVVESARVVSSEERTGRTVVVWGPVGSSGVSSVALALAGCAAQAGLTTLVVDAHVYGGAQSGLLNLFDEAPGIAAACRLAARDELSPDELRRVAAEVDHGRDTLTVLTGIPEAQRWTELGPDSVRAVLSVARSLCDLTVVDVAFCLEEDEEISSDLFAPRRNGATLSCLAAADVVVGVAGCDSLSLSRYILAMPRLREVIGNTPVVTVVNRLRASAAGLAPETSVRETLQRFAGIGDALCVPDDTELLDRALVAGMPTTWVTHRGRYVAALRSVFERVSQAWSTQRESSRLKTSA